MKDKMNKHINELIDILTREQAVFRKYLEFLNKQQELLIQNDPDGVRTITERINALAQEAANLESSRRVILAGISMEADTEPARPAISRIMALWDNPCFRDLECLKEAMLGIHQRVNEQKARNEMLIEQSIAMISQTMKFLHEVSNPRGLKEDPSFSEGQKKRNSCFKKDLKCTVPV